MNTGEIPKTACIARKEKSKVATKALEELENRGKNIKLKEEQFCEIFRKTAEWNMLETK
jgi:hypothetical protein